MAKSRSARQRGLRGCTVGNHGAVRVLMEAGKACDVIVDAVAAERAAMLREKAPASERRVADGLWWLGFKHSVPMHGIVADFFDPERRIVIEIDGPCHVGKEAQDKYRDTMLRGHGIRVWRFPSTWSYHNPISFVSYVKKLLAKHDARPTA